jgi:hypothetical protein
MMQRAPIRQPNDSKQVQRQATVSQRSLRKAMVSRVQIVLCRTRKEASNLQREHILNIFLTRDSVTIREAETLLSQARHSVSLGTVSRMMKMLCSIGFLMTRQYGEETWYQLVPLDGRAARMVYARGTRMRW